MKSEIAPAVSVITPTHNRSQSLRRLLDALAKQDYPMTRMEVIVVADGCHDNTAAMLRSYTAPYRLRVREQPGRGAAEARNVGAACARGRFLLFIDDDIEPCEELVTSHVRAHMETPGGVVLGPYPPAPVPSASIFRLRQRLWWTKRFESVAEPGHRFTYHDLLTGNLSLDARLWAEFGGLDPRFREAGGEDYEFGVRLMKAGVPFHFAPRAHAYHHEHETMSLGASLRRAYNEGHADVIMGDNHPETRTGLDFVHWYQHSGRRQHRIINRLYRLRGRGDRIARALQHLLPPLERVGLRNHWAALYQRLRFYWYMRGVTEALKSPAELIAYVWEVVPEAQNVQEIVLDLREGIAAAEACLDHKRPESVGLRYGRHILGIMPAAAGCEAWRGAHLRPFILRYCGPALLRAMALDGAIIDVPLAERQRLAKAIAKAGCFYAPGRMQPMWGEQSAQWERLDRQLAEIVNLRDMKTPVRASIANVSAEV